MFLYIDYIQTINVTLLFVTYMFPIKFRRNDNVFDSALQ